MLHECESPAPAAPRAVLPGGERLRSSDAARFTRGSALLLGLSLALSWLVLATWELERVPGMSLDEAWSILSARGQWAPHDPLSGMTSYAGPFPVLLLRGLGTDRGVLVLRGASVVANAAALVLLGLLIRRLYPGRRHVLWALPMIATCPAWLVVLRTGIEVVMFTPLLVVLGLYAFSLRTRWAALAGGVAWGLLIYNHVIGACIALALALAWRIAQRSWPVNDPGQLRAAAVGAVLGLAPRLAAFAIYNEPLSEAAPAGYSLVAALGDLRWVPICLWRTWHGDTVYQRYVGPLANHPWPYWSLGVVFLAPWLRRMRSVPAVAWFALLGAIFSALLMTLAAPYIAVRFLLLPVAGLTAFLYVLGAAAIERDARWRAPIVVVAAALSAFNVFYCVSNFHLPWHERRLALNTFWLGDRSKRTGNWAYFPKEGLVRELLALEPVPEQIVTTPTLERPLRVLLDGWPIRVALASDAEPALRSVYVEYRRPDALGPHCTEGLRGRLCFGAPAPIADFFLIYR